MATFEANIDGIVGPTHNYSGLSFGNVASMHNKQMPSNPKLAALQGLEKMHYLAQLGIKQAVLPPQERPHLVTLRSLGFEGSDQQILEKAFKQAPELFFACCSASSMWAANAATVSPSCDSQDGRLHITPANLTNKFHRSIEAEATEMALQAIFPNHKFFMHHSPLPSSHALADEGAANHTRFCGNVGEAGIQLFVFGRYGLGHHNSQLPANFPARQTYEASESIARLHQLSFDRVVFAQQHPKAIDAGVFHNDVISVGHENLFLYHELAFAEGDAVIENIRSKMASQSHADMILIKVADADISLAEAVSTYLFNSQIVTLADKSMHLIAPAECHENEKVRTFIDQLIQDNTNPINSVHYFNLRESMANGGGPACLRMRIVLTEEEFAASNQHVWMTDALYNTLVKWVEKYYRDYLLPQDLIDPDLLVESQEALDALSKILRL